MTRAKLVLVQLLGLLIVIVASGMFIVRAETRWNSDAIAGGDINASGIVPAASTLRMDWNHTWNGGYYDSMDAVAVDSDGTLYVIGEANSSATPGSRNVILAKYDASGIQFWNKTFGTPGDDFGEDLVLSADAIYIAWTMANATEAHNNARFDKYDKNGNSLVNITCGSPNHHDNAGGIALASDGFVVTWWDEKFSNPFDDVYVSKYAFNGTVMWEKTYTTYANQICTAVGIGNKDDVFVCGGSDEQPFVLKFASNGTFLWEHLYAYTDDLAADMVLDNVADVFYIAGTTKNMGYFGNYDAFLMKCNQDGTLLWNRTWGTNDSFDDMGVYSGDYAYSVVVNGSSVFVTGTYEVYAGGYNPGLTNHGTFINKYDKNGNLLMNYNWTTPTRDKAFGIAVDGNSIYLVGLRFITSPPRSYCFIAKFFSVPVAGSVPAGEGAWLFTLLGVFIVALRMKKRGT